MEVRLVKEGELWDAMNLCYQVFMEQVANSYTAEGQKTFLDFLEYNNQRSGFLAGRRKTYAAFEEDGIRGVLQMTKEGHITLLFVRMDCQRKGIAGELLKKAAGEIKELQIQYLTVNAAPGAVQAYMHLGFILDGEEMIENGIRYTPMHIQIEKLLQREGKKKYPEKKIAVAVACVIAVVGAVHAGFVVSDAIEEQNRIVHEMAQELSPYQEYYEDEGNYLDDYYDNFDRFFRDGGDFGGSDGGGYYDSPYKGGADGWL